LDFLTLFEVLLYSTFFDILFVECRMARKSSYQKPSPEKASNPFFPLSRMIEIENNPITPHIPVKKEM